MEEIKEIWKPIIGYEGIYECSNMGEIKSLNYNHANKAALLILTTNNNGYKKVTLVKNGKKKDFSVHRLIAQAFIPNPNNLPQVNHKDENKQNNMIWVNEDGSIDYNKSNLEWCDAIYNNNYGSRKERIKPWLGMSGGKHPKSRRIEQYTKEEEYIRAWDSISDIERELGFNGAHICSCANKKRKSANGFIWKYEGAA